MEWTYWRNFSPQYKSSTDRCCDTFSTSPADWFWTAHRHLQHSRTRCLPASPVGGNAYKPWYSGTIPTSRAAASTWLVPPDERAACCWDSWCLTSPLPPPRHAPAHPCAASLWCLPASLHEQQPTCASFLTSSGVVTMITIYSAISSLTTSLPHTIYPLTARLRAISPFFLAHIAHRTYPSTTACLLTVCDKKVSSTCNRTYVVIGWSLVAPPLNCRYCALRPTVSSFAID